MGLRFVRRLGDWRPGKEGRQEVIKVKVFEGQNVMFRGVVADRHYGRGGARDGCSRPVTKSGRVIVATITPDKLVRFWTSDGIALGGLDQVWFVRVCMR